MKFWFDHDVSGWGWFAMSASMILFWALIITAVVLLLRAVGQTSEHTHSPKGHSPEQVLAERFARGEIDEEEYRRRLATLHASGPPAKP
ncbi:SHOCT domain-containing protein [Streptomyces lunaelactis]|uniref:SHOCT domain-containing protein n=1 Tax=Streptomyces lunaelactis TaxID=1535768 RepID=UPI001584EC91|nr:SHOCT domain-containing protein [Streptomyces lunaelactis]NUK33629.1 SHOCT domain-containing protein [Streptomyces lunaelactis]NUK39378.1 SHOCT domain-containing protein [Streptomyces lunaelactis]NUK70098.1 SHOCT domain-containing protein [Streptomyces lunaelactis]NUK77443.1 SHOCT domain-containing protein [Streptomyces lunaelactis]NUK90394.1 SHOCT domain-containing protein [Streptomyces lunaelactis]